MAYFRCGNSNIPSGSFWDEYDDIIRRPTNSNSVTQYNALRTTSFTGVPADCNRILVQSYYNNYIVHFFRGTDEIVADPSTHTIPFGEWYRTNAFSPTNNDTQAVTLQSAVPSSYIPLPGATDYGTDVVINMNTFGVVENDNVVVEPNAILSDFTYST